MWHGAFATIQSEVHHTLVWDRVCTLWNAVSIETFLAAEKLSMPLASASSNNNNTSAGANADKERFKSCVQHYQNGANILSILGQLVECEDFSTVDFCKGMIQFWERVLIAQAQICIYKMVSSTQDQKHSMLSYLIAAAVPLFNDALNHSKESRLQSEVPKQYEVWGAYCKANSMMCSAKAEYHTAIVHRMNKQYGYEIARLETSCEKLQSCYDFLQPIFANKSTNMSQALLEIKKENNMLLEFVKNRLYNARKENRIVYQDEIPSREKLNEIAQKMMVKCNVGLPQSMVIPTVPLFTNL